MDVEEVIEKMRRIGTLVRHMSRRLNRRRGKKSSGLDLTFSQARTIWLLHAHESHTMSELAEKSAVSRPAATSNVDALEKLGMIERFADPSDRRVVRVQLSGKGRKWVQEHKKRHKEDMARILSKLSGRERAELAESLEKTYRILSRIDPGAEKSH
jgi:DNA-binding MarR family transcriptional regulator